LHSENWLFKFEEKDGSNLFFAFADETYDGNFYRGCILNKPSIRESIDLAKSTAKTSNISVTIPDFSYQGSPISEQLFGTNHFINQTVSVYSSTTSVTQIGSFRLIDVSTDGNKITLSLTSHRPWDFISIPQTKSTTKKLYFPIAYGGFTPESSEPIGLGDGAQYCDDAKCFPVPINEAMGDIIRGLLHFGDGFPETSPQYSPSNPVNENLHYFEPDLDGGVFVPLYPVYDSSFTYEGGEGISAPYSLTRGVKWNNIEEEDGNEATDIDKIIDIDTDFSDDYATTGSMTANSHGDPGSPYTDTVSKDFKIKTPQPDGNVTSIKVHIRYKIALTEITSGTASVKIRQGTSGIIIAERTSVGSRNGTHEATWTTTDGSIDDIWFSGHVSSTTEQTSEATGYVKINELNIYATISPPPDEPDSHLKRVVNLKQLYCGADGLPHAVTDVAYNGNAITKINEAHIDLLNRFTGLDPADLDTDTDLDGWNALNSARSGWDLRWWTLKSVELKKVLEKLQYEGGFIFRYKADGTPQYIHVPDSPSVDETLTKHDISDISVKHTPFSDLITKMEINYEKHPAENKYISSSTHVGSGNTVRDNWNIQTKENIKEIKLDALVDNIGSTDLTGDPNDGFADYYANIFGDIKLQVSGTIVNPDYFTLEVGKILNFSDMYPEKAFGEAWTGKDFMITSMSRTLGKTTFEAREI